MSRVVAVVAVAALVALVVGTVVAAPACVLFGISPVPCASNDDCPDGNCDTRVRQCTIGGDGGEGEGAEGEGAVGEGEGVGGGEPIFTDVFETKANGWPGWTCTSIDLIAGQAVEGGGTGNMVPTNFSRLDCAIPDVVVDVDMLFDVSLDADADPVGAQQSVYASVRRHFRSSGLLGFVADEVHAQITAVAGDSVEARFVAVGSGQQCHPEDVDGAATVTGTAATVPLALADPEAPVRVRVRVDGASPTRLRMKLWLAGDAEPGDWLIDAFLAGDDDFEDDDFGIALNMGYENDGPANARFDNVAIYDANTVSPNQPLAGP